MSASTADQDMEDDARRRQGAFFTPPAWAAEAHKQIEAALGSGWQDKHLVWDPVAGTGNLTHGVDLPSLMSSTLEPSDVDAMRDRGCTGVLFQHDFLNPGASDLPSAAEETLRAAASQGKRLLFFMNPPYGAASAGMGEVARAGMTRTSVADRMKPFKMGKASSQLFSQFIFQAATLAERYGLPASAPVPRAPVRRLGRCPGRARGPRPASRGWRVSLWFPCLDLNLNAWCTMTLSRLLPSVLLLISSAARAGRLNDGVAGVAWGAREAFPAPMEGCAHRPEPDAEWICQKKMGEASVRIGYTWKYGLVYGSVLEARSFLDCDTLRRVLKEAWGDGQPKSDYAKGPMDDWFWFDGPVASVWSYNQFSKICSVTVIHRPSMELVQLKDQEAARSISNGI